MILIFLGSEEPHRVASDDGSSSRAPSVPINRC